MRELGTEFRKLAAIMFTDMVGYSAMAQRNEALTLELLEEHRIIVRRILPRHRGDEIKTMGDAFLVEFSSALAAVRCAIEIQKAISDRNEREPEGRRFLLRIGIHLGDIVRRQDDVVGDGVNIAARIEPMAQPGGICMSEDVARQIQNKVNESLVRLGPGELKNIELPVVIYKLAPQGQAGATSFSRKAVRPPTIWENASLLLRSARLALLLAAMVIALVVVLVTRRTPTDTGPSIAVLPMASLSSTKDNDDLSDGVTEELINACAKIPGLHVLSRATTFSYKGKAETAARARKDLHVRHILEGSVRRNGDLVRVSVELVNAADGYQIWSETFDDNVTNAFALQQVIADHVKAAVKEKTNPEEAVGGLAALRSDLK